MHDGTVGTNLALAAATVLFLACRAIRQRRGIRMPSLRSATNNRPLESKARPWAPFSSPGADPFVPHSLMNVPSFEYFTIRMFVSMRRWTVDTRPPQQTRWRS